MFDTPDADPTCSTGTQDVEAEDAGPLDIPIPTAIAMSGDSKPVSLREAYDRLVAATDGKAAPLSAKARRALVRAAA